MAEDNPTVAEGFSATAQTILLVFSLVMTLHHSYCYHYDDDYEYDSYSYEKANFDTQVSSRVVNTEPKSHQQEPTGRR